MKRETQSISQPENVTEPEAAPVKKSIKLLAAHTDAGIDYEKDAEIVVDEPTARWLVTMKIGVEA